MNLLICVCLVLATWPSAFALYYTGIKEVFQPPTNRDLRNNSYFGYSITYDGFNKKLVISAPRENNIGEVYNCNIENRACTPIAKSVERVSPKYTHDYWFGATVKAGPDFVMMCAPRYTDFIQTFRYHFREHVYGTYGKCYLYVNSVLKEIHRIAERERLVDSGFVLEKTMDSFGWSIDVTPDQSTIVGGPGMSHGRAMIYNQYECNVPELIMSSTMTPEFNFGYSVASGLYNNDKMWYAVGSPYGYGQVTFYKGKKYLMNIKGDTHSPVGSMFGAVLCGASLNSNRTDLLVGAPTYASKNTYNLGAVFVYYSTSKFAVLKFQRKIVGQVSGSMFGSAIVNVGDLNGDEKTEIAIGAPFENEGHGVVYLYSGADLISTLTERDLKYLQRIEPENSYAESFGMSLTTLLDYGENGCRGLAIGSPYKDKVVLLKCMAAIVVKISATFPFLQERTSSNKTDFEFELCLTVNYPSLPKQITALVSTTVEMEHDYANLVDADGTGHVSFNTSLDDKKQEYCKNVSFILPLDGKYGTKINYTISTKLLNDPNTLPDFDSSRVVLSDRSDLTIRGSMWAAECAGNETCVPNLELTPYISFRHTEDDVYIIGSSTKETMHITVHNDGEVAYDSCVRVQIDGATVLKSGSCVYESSTDGGSLKCEPPKPLHSNKTWITDQIELEMTHLTNLDKTITIKLLLFNHCEDVATQNISILIPVKADPGGIVAKGMTDIGSIVNMTKEDIENNDKKIKHIYTIMNEGRTNWKELPIEVTLQLQPYIKYDDTPVTVYFSTLNLYTPCRFVSQNVTSMSYLCQVESLMTKLEFAKIVVAMNIEPGTLDGILDKDKNVTIMSFVKLQFIDDDDFKIESIATTITLQEGPTVTVPTEMIIILFVVGLSILIIITLILCRGRFFRRQHREQLKILKASVTHQTVLRSFNQRSYAQAPAAEQRIQVQRHQEEVEHDNIQAFKQTGIVPKKVKTVVTREIA